MGLQKPTEDGFYFREMVYLKNASASEMGPAHELTDSMELSPY
jgi:hypothetical protein